MSKAAKQSILILAILLIGSLGFAGHSLMEKQKVEKSKVALTDEVQGYKSREKKYISEKKTLNDQIKKTEDSKAKIQTELSKVDETIKGYSSQIEGLKKDRDEWKLRVETLQKERLDLLVKLEERPEPQVIYKYVEKEAEDKEEIKQDVTVDLESLDDSYWANVLKEKASMELQLGKLNSELSSTVVTLEELRKNYSDLELEHEKLRSDNEVLDREIKHGKDLADTLSLDLARSKGDKKFLQDRIDKIQEDNNDFRQQIKGLTATKITLEKSMVRLTEEKNSVVRKLKETENVIQGKIEEIWQIKNSLTKSIKERDPSLSKEIELPPIIVSSQVPFFEEKALSDKSSKGPGLNGNVVSVNSDNNFVIIDLGSRDGIDVGNKLGVYRNADYIAEVEVIQARADICAADIKQRTSNIKVGDMVR